jgi:hypothetical protein
MRKTHETFSEVMETAPHRYSVMFEIVFSLNVDFVQECNFDFSPPYLLAE